jgi:hypothetical protein
MKHQRRTWEARIPLSKVCVVPGKLDKVNFSKQANERSVSRKRRIEKLRFAGGRTKFGSWRENRMGWPSNTGSVPSRKYISKSRPKLGATAQRGKGPASSRTGMVERASDEI